MPPKKYHNSTIDCARIKPHTKELVDRCGGNKEAAEYALVGVQTIYRIMNGIHCTVQQETARKILLALEHRRKEDRTNKRVHERLLKARHEQARIENIQNRSIPEAPVSKFYEE